MKPNWPTLFDHARKTDGPMGTSPGDCFGAFFFQRGTVSFVAIVSEGDDTIPWEHVSVRAKDYNGERCPTWDEMCFIKQLFWDDEEECCQFHPKKSEYVNCHPHVLHIWRATMTALPTPPAIAVGIPNSALAKP